MSRGGQGPVGTATSIITKGRGDRAPRFSPGIKCRKCGEIVFRSQLPTYEKVGGRNSWVHGYCDNLTPPKSHELESYKQNHGITESPSPVRQRERIWTVVVDSGADRSMMTAGPTELDPQTTVHNLTLVEASRGYFTWIDELGQILRLDLVLEQGRFVEFPVWCNDELLPPTSLIPSVRRTATYWRQAVVTDRHTPTTATEQRRKRWIKPT
jgi:hypothetical protein